MLPLVSRDQRTTYKQHLRHATRVTINNQNENLAEAVANPQMISSAQLACARASDPMAIQDSEARTRLLTGVLPHEVHLVGLVLLGGQLHGAIQQVHLVHEQIPEDAGAVDHHVDAWPLELLQRDQLRVESSTMRVTLRQNWDHRQT